MAMKKRKKIRIDIIFVFNYYNCVHFNICCAKAIKMVRHCVPGSSGGAKVIFEPRGLRYLGSLYPSPTYGGYP